MLLYLLIYICFFMDVTEFVFTKYGRSKDTGRQLRYFCERGCQSKERVGIYTTSAGGGADLRTGVCIYATSVGGGADQRTWVSIYATSAGGGADLKTRVCIYATYAGGGADLKIWVDFYATSAGGGADILEISRDFVGCRSVMLIFLEK